MNNKNGLTQKELEFLRDYKGLTDEKKIEFIRSLSVLSAGKSRGGVRSATTNGKVRASH